MAIETTELEPVDRVRVTVLMDNLTDPLLVDQEAVARVNWPKALTGALPRATAQVSPDGVPDALIAEPGFSALVRVDSTPRSTSQRSANQLVICIIGRVQGPWQWGSVAQGTTQ